MSYPLGDITSANATLVLIVDGCSRREYAFNSSPRIRVTARMNLR